MASRIFKALKRKKILNPATVNTETRLARVLTTLDLTALGVGSTLGVGVYVLAGHVAKETAGPGVVISFGIAAIASIFAGLCYAEFGARAPRAGSAYIFSYISIGELIAFIIGWNLILEYVIGSAGVAKGLSLYLDSLCNDTLKKTFIEIAPIHIPHMATYFDFFAFVIPLLLSIGLAFGVKESSIANNLFTFLNIFVVLFVICVGSTKANIKNWNLPVPNNTNSSINYGKGGFLPFGWEGVIKGAATCFFGFVGFDCIATTGEEVRNPQRAIPISIFLSLFIIFCSYFGISVVITMMVPYYLEDPNAPIPHAFAAVGWTVAKWIVAIGAIFGLCASLFGAMFPLPRIIFSMASDGLIFKFLGRVNRRFSTPVDGTIFAGILTAFMAAMFELSQLVNMMSIGTLLAYTIVAACVLLLRYTVDDDYTLLRTSSEEVFSQTENSAEVNNIISFKALLKQVFNNEKLEVPTRISEFLVITELFILGILAFLIGIMLMYHKELINIGLYGLIPPSIAFFMLFLVMFSISRQPTSRRLATYQVPLVPLIPVLSILANIYLMLMLDVSTWIRFGVWMALGFSIYGFYGLPNSIREEVEYESIQ